MTQAPPRNEAMPGDAPGFQEDLDLELHDDRVAYVQGLDESISHLFGGELTQQCLRQKLALRHPMLDHQYRLVTEEIENLQDVAYDWIAGRKSGLYVPGLHRQGKTTAMNAVMEYLRLEFPYVAILSCLGQRSTIQTKKSFCEYLLKQFGYPTALIKGKAKSESILIHLLMTACAKAGGRQCVLFIDEAQLFSVTQYRYFLEIWNEMHRHGFLFGTVLVGQPELRSLKELTRELDHGAVVSRFFVKEYGFGGIKNLKMLEALLKQFDSSLVYPAGSTWTYSRFYLQQAFDHGWRLEKEAQCLWEALCKITKEKRSAIKTTGFRMAWIIDSVHSFLLDGMAQDAKKFQGTIDMWEECVMSGAEADLLL